MARDLVGTEALKDALSSLPGWELDADGKAIARTFEFRDFNGAFAFMTRVAMLAEKMDHHPDWSNVYRTVTVRLSTHDRGGVTELDIGMARQMNAFTSG